MPRLTSARSRQDQGQRFGEAGGPRTLDRWMEKSVEDEGQRGGRCGALRSLDQRPRNGRRPPGSAGPRASLGGWYGVALVAAVWCVCQTGAPLHPSLGLAEGSWRLLWACLLWTGLGGCGLALKRWLRRGGRQVPPPRVQLQPNLTAECSHCICSRPLFQRRHGCHVSLGQALTDSLLLCVLQEALPDPAPPHIQALLWRLESVSHSLERADVLLEPVEGRGQEEDKLRALISYLQQRARLLRGLLRSQGELEAGVKDLLEGLRLLWAQLEELHTRVTLTREWSQGRGDLDTAKTGAQNLSVVLAQYRTGLQSCQDHQTCSTQLLQELTWTHTHLAGSVGGSGESVWPEMLLQSNIEQFDLVQESFLSLEQQTSTFQAHLDGLDRGTPEVDAGPASGTPRPPSSGPVTSQSPPCSREPTPESVADAPPDEDTPPTLCERSALQFSSAFGRLRRSGRRK